MSLKYRDSQGTETPVAGLNGTSGELVPSVALYQTGYLNSNNLIDTHKDVTILDIEHPSVQYRVTFSTPMPDTDYVVIVDVHNTNLQAEVASADKTVNGFIVTVRNLVATMRADRGETTDGFTYSLIDDYFNWRAFKLMTDTVHEADAARISQNTANFAPAFSEVVSYAVGDYVTYNNILYRCTTAHTAGTWVSGHFTQVTVGGSIARYNDSITLPGYYTNDVLNDIKATADAVDNYKSFQGATQAGAEAAWFGFKKTSTYWHCTVWDGHGLVTHLVYKSGTYTCNVIHEGVSNT